MTGIGAKQKPITSYPGSTASGLGDERWDRFGGMSTHSSALGRMAELRRKRGTRPHRKEEDLIHLYTTERTYDAIAQGDLPALGLNRKFAIEAMMQNTIAALT